MTVSFSPTTHRPRSHSREFALCRLLPPNIAMSSSTITSSSPLNGSCFCGAVKMHCPRRLCYAHCHCTQCQRLTGISLFRILTHTLKRFVFRLSIHPYRVSCIHDHDAPVDTFVNLNPLRPWKTRTLPHGVTIRATRERTQLACGARTLPAMTLGVCCAGMKCDLLHTYFTGRLLDIEDGLGEWEGYEGKSDKID